MSPLKKTLIEFLIGLPIVIGLAALLDYLYQTFITHSSYQFSFAPCAACVGIWAVIQVISYLTRRNHTAKKEQDKE